MQGIPCRATYRWQLDVAKFKSGPDEIKKIKGWKKVSADGSPIVFINGQAKSKPTVEEIITAYQHGTKHE